MKHPLQTLQKLRQTLTAAAAILLTAGFGVFAWASEPPDPAPTPWEWTGVARVVAVGDVHGNHDKLVRLLTAAGLIDGELRWSGGDDHLVMAGDFLDRGLDDRPLMDLLRRLEEESAAAGGRVHVLLGNHEVMNLFWDLRYVNPESYRHFVAEERKGDRRAAVGKFAKLEGSGWGGKAFAAFNRKFPPGFFARQASLGPDGDYGRWLMGLPTIVKINDVVYTHGGMNPEFAALGVAGINQRVTEQIARYLEARQVLEREGVVLPVMNVLQVAEAAQKVVDKKGRRAVDRREAAEALLAAATDPILGGQGPLWYRGTALQDERLERDIVDQALESLGAKTLVVAHSPTTTNRITSRFKDRLFRIDYGIDSTGSTLALIAEGGETLVLDASTREITKPLREFPVGQLGGARNAQLSDAEMSDFLSRSPVIAARTLGRGSTRPQLIALEGNGKIRRGIFKTVHNDTGTDRYQHEVAAYRLDRALGLGMVPVTVLRTLGGQNGSLQAWVDGALDQETAQGYNLDFFTSERKVSQLTRAEVFDALIGNASRKPADILALVNDGTVLLIDHSKAFSTTADLPAQAAGDLSVPPSLAKALERLDRPNLVSQLGELISDAQIDALLDRRDKILAGAAVGTAASP